MKKEYKTIEELLKNKLNKKEESKALKLINRLKNVKKRGYFTKKEFVEIGMWKSTRPKKHYLKNSEREIISISKKVLSTKFEKRRIELLTNIAGVNIPTASAILTLIDPQNYGIIDIRVWQILYVYGAVKTKPHGTNFNFKNWYNYLMKIRYYARKFKVSARYVERTLFFAHRNAQIGNLYKSK